MQEKINKAMEAVKKSDWNEAINNFTTIVELQPDNAEVYNNLALCYANIGDFDKAEKNPLFPTKKRKGIC